nr:hypothetical protein [Candidatus Sigynarchaeota archaeon]
MPLIKVWLHPPRPASQSPIAILPDQDPKQVHDHCLDLDESKASSKAPKGEMPPRVDATQVMASDQQGLSPGGLA